MSHLELFADDIDGYLYVAVINNGLLIDLYINPPDIAGNWASIYLGKVTKLDTNLDAAFIDLGNGLTGYLPAEYAAVRIPNKKTRRSEISTMLRTGETLLVQIKAEGKEQSPYENQKLPRLTSNLHVPGGFLVYSPHSDHINYSSTIDEDYIDKINTKINLKGGWKVYPSVRKLPTEDINFEANYLKKRWKEILAKKESLAGQSGLIEVGPIALFRALLDYGSVNFEHIYIGNKVIMNLMLDWCSKHQPNLADSKRLRLYKPEKPEQRLFDIYDLYSEIDILTHKLIHLRSGGNIIIENTSAFTTIDVNQGSSKNKHEANYNAAQEIARQIRIRNLSGVILIDFAGVPNKDEKLQIIEILEKALATDIGDAQVHGFTRLGIVEITRRRRTATTSEKLK